MELFSKVTALLLLLLVFVLGPVRLQDITESTSESPRRTISKEWLRQKLPPSLILEPRENDVPSSDEQSGVESGMDSSGGVASGSAFFETEDETNGTAESTTRPSIYTDQTTLAAENQDSGVSTTTQWPSADGNLTDVDTRINQTVFEEDEEVTLNSTNVSTTAEAQSTTTTKAPETSTTDAGELGSGGGGVVIETGSTGMTPTTAAAPETTPREESDEETTTTSTEATSETTAAAPVTPDLGNASDKGASAEGGSPERGFSSETSDSEKRRRKGAWGAVLGTFVAIALVALAAYIILKKKHHKAFSHRKLEEDFPSDPVLRLDNSEPLDLNFGRAAYYNPGLQTDSIQMSPFPKK